MIGDGVAMNGVLRMLLCLCLSFCFGCVSVSLCVCMLLSLRLFVSCVSDIGASERPQFDYIPQRADRFCACAAQVRSTVSRHCVDHTTLPHDTVT